MDRGHEGSRSAMSLPLQGIRVLDLSRLLPGGFCSLLLADFGAEVLKVEDTGMGDYIRWAPPYYEGAEDSAKSALFLSLNRNKRSIRIDLKSEAGRGVLLRLVHDYDVVLESFRPGVLDRLGVGYERMREVNPGIVYCAISGYGQDGPKREAAGHDMNYLALVGLLGLTGERDGVGRVGGHPIQSAGQIADLGGGALMAAFGILAALRERDGGLVHPAGLESRSPGSGQGQVVDVSMADGALSWLAMVAGRYFAEQRVPHRGDLELAGSLICYRPYECADGWVALGALEPKFWQAWCRGVEREDLIEKQFEGPGSAAHAQVCDVFKKRTRAQWEEFAHDHDCCLEPVLDLDEALDSELVRAREMVVEIEQPGVAGGVRQLGLPVKLSRTPGHHAQRPGPGLGEHTVEVLREAGCSAEEIDELMQAGAVAGPAQAQAGATAAFRA
jgi:alpha-methylacyl-CoA racemase